MSPARVHLGVLGAVIAGGRSTRYGAPKALETVAGERVVDRVVHALGEAGVARVFAIVNDSWLADQIGLPHRPDLLQDAGALAGVHAALVHARDTAADGVLAVACDMPFLSVPLLQDILMRSDGADVVVPESEGPRGIEPLCAYYDTTCIPLIEQSVARGDARMIGFHDVARVKRVPLDVVRTHGDPAVMFRNMNTPADREMAERIARGDA